VLKGAERGQQRGQLGEFKRLLVNGAVLGGETSLELDRRIGCERFGEVGNAAWFEDPV